LSRTGGNFPQLRAIERHVSKTTTLWTKPREVIMSLYAEFKAFIRRGNVVDLAVGVIMGGAFGKIVNSLVADVLMPPIGYIIGGTKFTELKIKLPEIKIPDPLEPGTFKTLEPATINIGNFIQATFDFLIISICIFAIIKAINSLKQTEPVTPAEATPTEKLLIEIRDLLKNPPNTAEKTQETSP
jgi:large conductance mechanosensitive channel